MNRTLIIVSTIIIALLSVFSYVAFTMYKAEKTERLRQQANVVSLRADTTKFAAALHITRKEFKALYAEKTALVEALGYKANDVQAAHFIRYVYKHDTIAYTDTILQYYPADGAPANTLVWQFAHGCITSQVSYAPGNEYATDTLVGDINITRLVVYERPTLLKRIFVPRNWWRANWPTRTVIDNNCGFNVKENTSIIIE